MVNNKTIITTQPITQAQKLLKLLQSNNLLFYSMPLIYTQTIKSNPETEKVLKNIKLFTKIIFTSKRGVASFFELVKEFNPDKSDLEQIEYAAIGTSTAAEILKNGLQVNYINRGNTSKEFAEYLLAEVINPNEKLLLPFGNLAPEFLQAKLSKQADCTRINVYETIKIKNPDKEILNIIDKEDYDLLIFTSPSAFENFIEITNYKPNDKQLKILSIGQTTTDFIEKKGFKVQITAKKSTIEGLADEIKIFFNK